MGSAISVSIFDQGAPYGLHGFSAVYLPDVGWYRVDPRGNREGVDAQFAPPEERLAFKVRFAGEAEFQNVLAEPLEIVVKFLQAQDDWESMLHHLPDVPLESAGQYGLLLL
jgi:transglutaminase-like putative cysteine protease